MKNQLKLPFFISEASLMMPERICPSTWLEHIPFAFWLTSAYKPATIVELGSYYGGSYFSFCQMVEHYGFASKCYAVDTWKGDDQSGFYDDAIFKSALDYNQKKYSIFSTLIRSTFDQALEYFGDSTIDLLHIDGYHTYEEVKNDFEKWLPKLTPNAVVLFHDINVKERGFGVCKLWEELKNKYRNFSFFHGSGLGVLAIGNEYPSDLQKLFNLTESNKMSDFIRRYYNRLGSSINYLYLYEQQASH